MRIRDSSKKIIAGHRYNAEENGKTGRKQFIWGIMIRDNTKTVRTCINSTKDAKNYIRNDYFVYIKLHICKYIAYSIK